MIGIGSDESKRINNDDKDENDSIEKEDYKYNEDKCNNKDNDDDSDNDDWKIECIDVIDTDCIHPPRGVERRAKLGAGHSESINADYINIIYNIYLYRYYC